MFQLWSTGTLCQGQELPSTWSNMQTVRWGGALQGYCRCPKLPGGNLHQHQRSDERNGGQRSAHGGSHFRSKCGRNSDTNYIGDSRVDEPQASSTVPHGPDYAFAVNSNMSNGVVTLNVGGVDLPDVLIDSGATCNLMGQGTWEWLKKNGVQCDS